jgi:hypothetical protein
MKPEMNIKFKIIFPYSKSCTKEVPAFSILENVLPMQYPETSINASGNVAMVVVTNSFVTIS